MFQIPFYHLASMQKGINQDFSTHMNKATSAHKWPLLKTSKCLPCKHGLDCNCNVRLQLSVLREPLCLIWLALLCSACLVLLGFALLCFALLCFALLCFALPCFALLCCTLLCFVLETSSEGALWHCWLRGSTCLQSLHGAHSDSPAACGAAA